MYHLKKAIYHLKQAPSAWFHRFSIFFLTHGSSCSQSDSYMFTFGHTSHILILLLYVDDIIQTDNSISRLFSFISTPSQQFAMKELGDLCSILGVQVIRSLLGLFLSQHKHIYDLLLKFHLHTCKLVRIPIVAKTALSLSECELLAYLTDYRSMVGALQELTMYLTIPRFDIA